MSTAYHLNGFDPQTARLATNVRLMPRAAEHALTVIGRDVINGELALSQAQVASIFKFGGLAMPKTKHDWFLGLRAC